MAAPPQALMGLRMVGQGRLEECKLKCMRQQLTTSGTQPSRQIGGSPEARVPATISSQFNFPLAAHSWIKRYLCHLVGVGQEGFLEHIGYTRCAFV